MPGETQVFFLLPLLQPHHPSHPIAIQPPPCRPPHPPSPPTDIRAHTPAPTCTDRHTRACAHALTHTQTQPALDLIPPQRHKSSSVVLTADFGFTLNRGHSVTAPLFPHCQEFIKKSFQTRRAPLSVPMHTACQNLVTNSLRVWQRTERDRSKH